MARFKGWKSRYAYLDDYKRGMDGSYVYYGRHYIYSGEGSSLKQYKWMLGGMDLLAAALFILGGFQDAGVIWNTWLCVVPYAAQALVIFLLIWKTLSLILEKVPVKAYIYKRTVPWFRPLGIILAVITGISLTGIVITMLRSPEAIRMKYCVIYLVTQVLMGCAAFVFQMRIRRYGWEPDPQEEAEGNA